MKFIRTASGVELEYQSDRVDNGWVWRELEEKRSVTISMVFEFDLSDLINAPSKNQDIDGNYAYKFAFGTFEGEYIRIPGRILAISNDVILPKATKLERKIFAAERNISIFGRISKLINHDDPIVLGGLRRGAMPWEVFEELLKRFPNSYEVDRYAAARIDTILSSYIDGMTDARGQYETYLNKKAKTSVQKLDISFIRETEIQKYSFIYDFILNALKTKTALSEGEWQNLISPFLLLLFPKYIKLLEGITINDYYSNKDKKTPRYIDLSLIDANGNLDIIELKRPFDNKILRKSEYRGNSIPTSELSGGIMQAEKYLFHLSKWGIKGENELTRRYGEQLPKGMQIRISNPKAIIIVGRDQIGGADMSDSQLLDFEIIKRKYANMVDIITYDDLLRRLNNTIVAMGGNRRK